MSKCYIDYPDYTDFSRELEWMNTKQLEKVSTSLERWEYFKLNNKNLAEEIRILIEEDNQKIMSIVNFIKWTIYTQENFSNIDKEGNFLIQGYDSLIKLLKHQKNTPCDLEILLTWKNFWKDIHYPGVLYYDGWDKKKFIEKVNNFIQGKEWEYPFITLWRYMLFKYHMDSNISDWYDNGNIEKMFSSKEIDILLTYESLKDFTNNLLLDDGIKVEFTFKPLFEFPNIKS